MNGNLEVILEQFEKLKGQFIITESNRIERLIGIGTDEKQIYYITYGGKKAIWNPFNSKIIPLKGFLRDDDYKYFVENAKTQHFDQIKNTMIPISEEHRNNVTKLSSPSRFLTEICWELN